GVHYVGVTLDELRRVVSAALAFCVVMAAVSVSFASLAAGLGATPLVDAALGFAPGGQAEMVLLAIVAGADVAYVVTLHIARIIIVLLGAPMIARLAERRRRG
ncbi:MAG: AbrB family transcriptional regulator, partial [Pseudomonadota bacterium]